MKRKQIVTGNEALLPSGRVQSIHWRDGHAYIEDMLRAAAYHAAQGRYVQKVATRGQGHIVFTGRAIIGGVKVKPVPCLALVRVWAIDRGPGVLCVGTN